MTNKRFKFMSVLAIAAAGLLATPVFAQENGDTIIRIDPSNLAVTDVPSSLLQFNSKQGSDGTYWVWRHRDSSVLTRTAICPSTRPSNCAVKFDYINSQLPSNSAKYQELFVFGTRALASPYVFPAPLGTYFSVDYKLTGTEVPRYLDRKRWVTVAPKAEYSFSLKPGQRVYATVISLDKYVPMGEGSIMGGSFPFAWGSSSVGPQEFRKQYRDEQVGTWEGHAYTKTRMHFCVTTSAVAPVPGAVVKCNAPPQIANGQTP